jgi:beta-glucanase (GH16 family)
MRLATARRRRIAGDLTRSWRHRGRRRELVIVSFGLCLAMLCATDASVNLASAVADAGVLTGLPVPRDQLQAIDSAALSCPELSPPKLAAQVMAASRFDPRARTADGGSGVAGLTAAQWRQWAPAPGDMRSDAEANIVALAHDMCDLAGQVRTAHVPGDGWRLSLAAFHSGLPAVIAAHGIPAGAVAYVDTVAAYADWYTQQPQFGGTGVPASTSAPPGRPSPTPSQTPSPAPSKTPSPAPSKTPSQTPSPRPSPTPASGWRLVWSDEFNGPAGSAPNASKWNHDTGGNGWGNSELEYYTGSTANAALDGHGDLVITARSAAGSGLSCWYGPCSYTSARLNTLGRFAFEYGQISASIELPSGQGLWPSFWAIGADFGTVGWPQSGMIDLLSNLGSTPATMSGGLVGPGYSALSGYSLSSGTFAGGYHTFTADWYPDRASFFVDGHLYATEYRSQAGAGWVFDHPFSLVLNLAVGGSQPGAPDAATTFPQQMRVAWVRVYQAGPTSTPARPTLTSSPP